MLSHIKLETRRDRHFSHKLGDNGVSLTNHPPSRQLFIIGPPLRLLIQEQLSLSALASCSGSRQPDID